MGGLTSAVHWWQESQLRVLVLSSMAVQLLLFTFSFLRRRALPGWVRFIMWLAYIGGDAVAIYALATLFNRHKAMGEDGGGGSSGMLEVFWAPVLLIHLGGHDGITAYNIEDNELWSRHLLTAVSQVTVAIYVFCKTWPPGGDKRLLQSAIVLFVPGVLKCFQKPQALKSASIYSLVSSPAAVKQEEGEMYALEEYVKRAKVFVGAEAQGARASSSMEDEEGEAQGARASSSMEDESHRPRRSDMEPAGTSIITREMLQGHNETSKLFVDLSSSYSHRLSILEDFCGLKEESAYDSVRQGLVIAFLRLYTKLKTVNDDDFDDESDICRQVMKSIFSSPTQASRLFLPWAAIGLFHHSHREAYNNIDVKITYLILCCTAALELVSINEFRKAQVPLPEEWPEMVAQHSFIGYVARSIKHSDKMRNVSRQLGFKDFLDQHHWGIRPCFSSRSITGLVHQYLKAGWKQKMHDAASYRRFNDNRGHWALEGKEDHLGWSIKGQFDESVLRWHIATDFCFFLSLSSSDHKAVLCRQMSNYMAYLLLVNPEMLLPGSRRNLCTRVQEELEAIFKNSGEKLPPVLQKTELTLKITSKLASSSQGFEGTLIQEAWRLAQKLQSLGDEKKMWEVIQGVWVEMLCYSAGRCRGYLHAKALGQGGEFLSYVWLLMFYMGMETFTDKLQREDLPSHEAAGTGNNATTTPPSTSKRRVSSTTGTAASASVAHADAAGASAAPSTSEICKAEDMV